MKILVIGYGEIAEEFAKVNRGVEISSEIADSSRSLILQQVSNGIAVRMAILSLSMQKGSES